MGAGLNLADTRFTNIKLPKTASPRKWPKYQDALGAAELKGHAISDRSMADFMWSKLAFDKGWSIEEIAERLLEVSENAQEKARLGDKD